MEFIVECKTCGQKYESDSDIRRFCGNCIMSSTRDFSYSNTYEMTVTKKLGQPKPTKVIETIEGKKLCLACSREKEYKEFYKDGSNKVDGCTRLCRVCYKFWHTPEQIKKRKDEKRVKATKTKDT